MQIDPGTVAPTAAPSGLQMNSLNSKAKIAPGTIVVPTSPTVPTISTATSGLQVKSFAFLGGGVTVDAMSICRLIRGR
jgi:hypothetical protein